MFCELPDFGRCCFCLPLRQGILAFGYINVLFSAFMISVYSYMVHNDTNQKMLLFHGSVTKVDDEICLVFYIFDFLFAVALVYGGHTKNPRILKVFYYYAMTSALAALLLQVSGVFSTNFPISFLLETCGLFLFGFCLHLYLLFLVRSLLKKLEISGHTYENQLHQIVNGEIKKHTRLLTIYFYYGVTTTLATFLTMFIINYDLLNRDPYHVILEVTFIVSAIVLHAYMVCLVWNMIKKLKQNTGLSFVNQVAEVIIEAPTENIRNPL